MHDYLAFLSGATNLYDQVCFVDLSGAYFLYTSAARILRFLGMSYLGCFKVFVVYHGTIVLSSSSSSSNSSFK